MKTYFEKSITFDQYLNLIDELLADGKTTGPNQSKTMAEYSKLNRCRMSRLEKTAELSEGVLSAVRGLERRLIWLILTEGWCGDAAQNIPVIEKIAAESDNIETRYLLRDENPELMDRFLTEGARAIPKLIALDAETHEILGTWGARPRAAQELFVEMKSRGIEKPQILESIQRWYNADKGKSLQAEFEILLKGWNVLRAASAKG